MNEGRKIPWIKRKLIEYLMNKALRLSEQGKYKEAMEHCNQTLKIIPNDPHIIQTKAQFYRNLEEYDTALKYIEQALQYSDADYRPHCMYIKTQILYYAGRYQKAVECADRSINSGAYSPDIYDLKGLALYRMHDNPMSEKQIKEILYCYNKSIEYEPSSLILANKGLLFLDLEEYDKAIKYFKEALSLWTDEDPIKEEVILDDIAYALYKTGRYEEALKYCRKFIKKDSKDPNLLYSIATTLYNLGSLHKALDAINASIKIDPTIPNAKEFRQDIRSKIKEQKMEE